jgi:hypothetical protein
MKKNKKKFHGGNYPEESYDKQLLDDPAYMKPSVYVPDDIKTKINKWAKDMGMKKESRRPRKKIILEVFDSKARGVTTKKIEMTHEFAEKVLGFDFFLLETVSHDYELQDELLREYFLHEGFLDSVEAAWQKVKKKTDDTAIVIKSIKNIVSKPENIELVLEHTLSRIGRYMQKFLFDKNIDTDIKNILQTVFDSVKKKSGWQGLLLSASYLVILTLMASNKDWFEMDGATRKLQELIEEFNNSLVQNPSSMSSVVGWLVTLKNIVKNLGDAVEELAKIFKRVEIIKSGEGIAIVN